MPGNGNLIDGPRLEMKYGTIVTGGQGGESTDNRPSAESVEFLEMGCSSQVDHLLPKIGMTAAPVSDAIRDLRLVSSCTIEGHWASSGHERLRM